ncbi:MAG: precorrin-4 C(11)-methyltransferase [Bacteriovoracaceae bacterium]
MKVYIIGAGPGDPELITVKGARLIETCPYVLYTGSLVPKAVIERADKEAFVMDSSGMDLDAIMEFFIKAKEENKDVARVHTGDPSLFGSTAEQMRRLDDLGIEWEIIPGVSSFSASAAALKQELTLPEVSQTVIITRMEGRTPMPPKEKLKDLAKSEGTLVLFLSVGLIKKVVDELSDIYPSDYPVAVVQKASWPDQKIVRGNLENIVSLVKKEKITATAIIVISKVLGHKDFPDSRLYASDFTHGFRVAKKDQHLSE